MYIVLTNVKSTNIGKANNRQVNDFEHSMYISHRTMMYLARSSRFVNAWPTTDCITLTGFP